MWKSVIGEDHEEQDESGTGFNLLFLEWVEALKGEPWSVALQDLVKWTKIWTGTEEELMKEVRLRVNREVWEAEDFPSDFRKLMHYYEVLYFSLLGLNLNIFDYRDLSKEDLKGFYAPGWGPGAPILIERDGAAQPSYNYATYKLAKYEDPLLLAFLIFTESTKFARGQRWSGSTDELIDVLRAHYPMPCLNCRVELAHVKWASYPEGASDDKTSAFLDHSSMELLDDVYLGGPSDYRRFHARMKMCADTLLEEAGIKVSKTKETRMVREPGGEVRKTKHTRWTVEGPRWPS
jgi:hypothetical protein